MPARTLQQDDVVSFLRKRDYVFKQELGQGACGKTVLLYDDQIDENFVCKKYRPYEESQREVLFKNFVREVKLLHQLHHPNVVRVFNYYLNPVSFTGYILMEFVDGADIEEHIKKNPDQINDLFTQAISGFAYLERSRILHRDIRPGNILVNTDGRLKIIDLGFGKRVAVSADFEKSINLNWWCPPPSEFERDRYDFTTEVYFVGQLFERIITQNQIKSFRHMRLLGQMCQQDPDKRSTGFQDVERLIQSDRFYTIGFTDAQLEAYRDFADALSVHITKVKNGTKYTEDINQLISQLSAVYRSLQLEIVAPDAAPILHCFLSGNYYYRKLGFSVSTISAFLDLIISSTDEQKRIILANICSRLDAIKRYSDPEYDDVPF